MWLSLGTLQVSRALEGGKSLPEGGTQQDFVPHLQLQLGLCIHAPVMASLDHGGSPQDRNSEFPGLAAPEQPSLAEISACVYMSRLCLVLTAGNLQETLAVGISALLFGYPWGCAWAHVRLQLPCRELRARFCSPSGKGKNCTSFSRAGIIAWSEECIYLAHFPSASVSQYVWYLLCHLVAVHSSLLLSRWEGSQKSIWQTMGPGCGVRPCGVGGRGSPELSEPQRSLPGGDGLLGKRIWGQCNTCYGVFVGQLQGCASLMIVERPEVK